MHLTPAQRGGINGGLAAIAWMRKRGHTPRGQQLWSTAEEAILRRCYPDYAAAQAQLPHRTRSALEHKVAKLGISKPRRIFTVAQEAALPVPYRRGDAVRSIGEALGGKTVSQVYRKANGRGYRRPRRRPRLLGCPIIDDIRQRAFGQRLTLHDLDALARTGGFFERGRRSLSHVAINRALALLGGRPQVTFPP